MINRRNFVVAGGAFGLGILAAVVLLRQPTVPLTQEVLSEARRRWDQSGIRDYKAKYRMHGSLYEVDVEGGLVAVITVNEQTLSIAEPGSYSIEGLFNTLQTELDNIDDPSNPLGTPSGNVLARVQFDSRLGFPRRYVRGGTGLSRGSTLEMLEFTPAPARKDGS